VKRSSYLQHTLKCWSVAMATNLKTRAFRRHLADKNSLSPSHSKSSKSPIQATLPKGGLAPQCITRAPVSFCFVCVVARSVLSSSLCLKETVLAPKRLLWKGVRVKSVQVFLEHPNEEKTRRENDRNPQVKSPLFPIVMSEATAIVQRNPFL